MKHLLLSASILGLGFGAAYLWRSPRRSAAPSLRRTLDIGRTRERGGAASTETDDVAAVTQNFLAYFVVPIWAASGIADWICHRATHIESTTGAKESLLHLLMLAEMAVPVLAGLFLEITSPVLALMIAAFFLHEATALWDVSYAVTRREVTPVEQHVHSFLEMVPLMALSFIAVLHWPQMLALFGLGPEGADLSIRRKESPLPTNFIAADLGSDLLFAVLPYLEELWRTLGLSVDWSMTYTTIGTTARRASQRAFLRMLARDEAYQSEAPTLWDVDFRMAVSQAELEDRELPGAYHSLRFGGTDGQDDLVIETTRPELLPACVALVAHPDDERYQPRFGHNVTTPLFGVQVPVLAQFWS